MSSATAALLLLKGGGGRVDGIAAPRRLSDTHSKGYELGARVARNETTLPSNATAAADAAAHADTVEGGADAAAAVVPRN